MKAAGDRPASANVIKFDRLRPGSWLGSLASLHHDKRLYPPPPTIRQLTQRIAQFENMTAADPENEMAHFSLGNSYLKAGRHAEAAGSLERVTELNPDMSKAFQLAGESMIQAGWEDKAVVMLEKGYEIAASKGDLMVRDAISKALEDLGRTPPLLSAEIEAEAARSAEGGSFTCRRTGKNGTALEQPPFQGRHRCVDSGKHLQRDLERLDRPRDEGHQ